MKLSDMHKAVKRQLEAGGWTKGTSRDFQGKRCLAGAYLDVSWLFGKASVYDQVREDLGIENTEYISYWNDLPETTIETVFERLDKAIETATAREAGE